jgi:signal transduction histidine kinase/CheY-like chemotaxis protein/HPt (histidine-containing phosphotransfer) domain-containing protein
MKKFLRVFRHRKQLFAIFLVFLFMVCPSYFSMVYIMERQISANAREALSNAESAVEARLREMATTVYNISLVIEDSLSRGESADRIARYVTRLARDIPDSRQKIPGFLSVYGYIDGVFFDSTGLTLPEDYDPPKRRWYTDAARARGGVTFTVPRSAIRGGLTALTASQAVRGSRGRIAGVAALDVDLGDVSEFIESLKISDGGYGILLSSDLNVIAYPLREYVGEPYSRLNAEIARRLADGDKEFSARLKSTVTGGRVTANFRQIDNGLYLGIATPMFSYYHNVYLLAAVMSLLGLGFMAMISCYMIRLSDEKNASDEANRGKSSFLARISHEIRTPMNSILGMSELLLKKNIIGDVRDYVTAIHQSGSFLLELINELLDFSKIESGALKLEPRNYAFGSLIDDVINVIRTRIIDKPLDFFVSVDSRIPASLYGDDSCVRQIALNLLVNAFKYTERGFISLDVSQNPAGPGRVELSFVVSDSGIGIKKEDIGAIFDSFSRATADHVRRIEGAGLGLALVSTYCSMMGGGVSVESEFGRGSTFTARIIQSYRSGDPAASASPDVKILLFDGRPRYLDSLAAAAANLGADAVRAESFDEFAERLAEGECDFAFVPGEYFTKALGVRRSGKKRAQLAVMSDMKDAGEFADFGCLFYPVYSLSMANALAGVFENIRNAASDTRTRLILKDAHVLIVDDIPSNLRVAQEFASFFDAVVSTCKDGESALRLIRKKRFDVIFMDHMMPGMDGVETTAAIRAMGSGDPYYAAVPIIALTANASPAQREMLLANGFDDYLSKPIDAKRMERVFRAWIPAEKQTETASAGDAPEEPAEKLSIRGVDTEWGLKNTGGKADVYRDVLTLFCGECDEHTEKIRDALRKDDLRSYATSVHGLKGSARSVGAFEIANFAARLEEGAVYGNRELVLARTEKLLENARALVVDVRTARLERHSGEKGGFPNRASLESMKSALREMDAVTIDTLLESFSAAKPGGRAREFIRALESSVLMFEYENAIRLIDEVLEI